MKWHCIIQCAFCFSTWTQKLHKLANKQSDFAIKILLLSTLRAGHLCHSEMTLVLFIFFPSLLFLKDIRSNVFFFSASKCPWRLLVQVSKRNKLPKEWNRKWEEKRNFMRAHRIKVLDNKSTDMNKEMRKKHAKYKKIAFETGWKNAIKTYVQRKQNRWLFEAISYCLYLCKV